MENVQAIIEETPFSSTWITTRELRTKQVVLEANQHYWDKQRGPRLDRLVFRNDLSKQEALEKCMTTEGEVDIVTELTPVEASSVQKSPYAKLVTVQGNKMLIGVFNYFKQDIHFYDRRIREAINFAVDRASIIQNGFGGYADEVPALTPPWAFDFPRELTPRQYEPERARQLLLSANYPKGRTLTVATTKKYENVANIISDNLRVTLGINVHITVILPNDELKWKRVIAEKKLVPAWDILLTDASALFLEVTPAFFHREFFGRSGMYRMSPVNDEFETLFNKMTNTIDYEKQVEASKDIDRYVYKEALGLFLCSPRNLYAVNKHVNFKPYRTSLEFAETSVNDSHWSRR
ncbi:ABC transporter substrate-binding protein [Bacillus suaedaesalsae]|uniref:ABC transporter substrate-binding protein n=1 Tax=Bacillus suaedaesalsae TaxID=2810349 RepID=A0ABS2DH43_9BACI|nr:ABC transporter substrate-binding protein [Bacillus suaedaesalsae]